ncbi:MAG: hypothetical protein ACRDPG_10065 [Nocardioidaceae bacterium]
MRRLSELLSRPMDGHDRGQTQQSGRPGRVSDPAAAGRAPASIRRKAVAVTVGTGLVVAMSVGIAGPAQAICNPRPPDYPGCTARQAAPQTARWATYQFHHVQFGQHHPAVIWRHLTHRQNHHLRRAYHRFVIRWTRHHTSYRTGPDGARMAVVHYPVLRSWRAFKRHTVGVCSHYLLSRFPDVYCAGRTVAHPQTRHAISRILDSIGSFVGRCNGALVGGVTGGAATGALLALFTEGGSVGAGAVLGGFAGEVGCQGQHLWNSLPWFN